MQTGKSAGELINILILKLNLKSSRYRDFNAVVCLCHTQTIAMGKKLRCVKKIFLLIPTANLFFSIYYVMSVCKT